MAFFKRVFSSDYRRALAAEAAGEYVEAARAYALSGEKVKVGEMHLLAAERAATLDGRVAELRTAARWAEGHRAEARDVRRRVARALLEHVRQIGVISDGDRKLLHEAAAHFHSAGDHGGAGESLELAGDEVNAAHAYQEAGEVERLEKVLALEEGRRHQGDRLRAALSEYEFHLRAGTRDTAVARLREVGALDPSGPARHLLGELTARLVTGGSVWLRADAARTTSIYIGAFPLGIGREQSCEMPLRDAGVSRRHAEVLAHSGRFWVRDCKSRNGTLIGGLRVDGELPLPVAGELGLGDLVSVAFRSSGERLDLEVVRGTDRGLRAIASPSPIPLPGGAAHIRFVEGRPLVEPAAGHRLVLNSTRAAAEVQLIRGDVVEVLDAAGAVALRLAVEQPT